MDVIFFILSFVCFIALIIGIIKPQLVVKWGKPEKRNRMNVLKYYGIGLIATFILFGITIESTETPTAKSPATSSEKVKKEAEKEKELTAEEKAAAEQKAAEEKAAKKAAEEKAAAEKAEADRVAAEKAAAEKAAKEEEERIGYETGITYDQLARTPDDFEGKKAKFTGTVVQVIEGDGETQLRIAVDDNYDTILFVAYDSEITSSRVLDNDTVTVKGVSQGLITYQSTMGGEISIPSMLVKQIEIIQ
ncbi:hypothetical protein HHO41_18590 [Bacillus sp. DNRA2]|uniref:hypothetical protein n=1 Tax=Bacillus sp. DNRA2 TaxID=2723053 RepID=UPI00145CD456|nr:hypothetical protein [Bacillus sp. DNRA2]NMD72282.1 hypothetical protein [Bacillus sp. DNRA2]